MPLEQYSDQFGYGQLWNELRWSTRSQLKDGLWYKLFNELHNELQKEFPIGALTQELEHRWYP